MKAGFLPTPCLPLFLAALTGLGPVAASAADWQALTGNSPFGQSAAPAAAAPDELEFRGVVQEEGVYLVNLFNPATKTSQWVAVNGRAPGLEVRSYDARTDKVEVTQGGRSLTLPLKQARVTLVQAAPAPLPENPNRVAGGGPGVMGGPGGPAGPGDGREGGPNRGTNPGDSPMVRNLPPEAQAMIQEFRRRRAERANQGSPVPRPRQQ